MTGGDPSSSASHIKKSAVEQVGWAGGQPQPMGTGGRGGGRSITSKSSVNVAVKWVKHRGEKRGKREDGGVSLRLMSGSSRLWSVCAQLECVSVCQCVCICLKDLSVYQQVRPSTFLLKPVMIHPES